MNRHGLVLAERGFLPQLRERLDASARRPVREVLVELATGFGRMLADHAELVRVFFSGSAGDPRIRAALAEFVTEVQHLLGTSCPHGPLPAICAGMTPKPPPRCCSRRSCSAM